MDDIPVDAEKLTKGQKKKLKEKRQKEEAAKAAAEGKTTEEVKAPAAKAAPAKGAAAAGKGKNSLIFRIISSVHSLIIPLRPAIISKLKYRQEKG